MMFWSSSCGFVLLFAILIYANICDIANAEKISDKRLCGDRNCQTLISKARTLARHKPTDPAFLPFERGTMIDIYSKSAGSRQDLWGGELNGRKGYFPRSFVREYKVENPSPQHVVDTEYHMPLEERLLNNPERRQVPQNARTVKQETRQQDTPRQPPTEQVHERKQEKSQEENKQQEPADETEIDDETELADDDQETENIEAGSAGDTNQAESKETIPVGGVNQDVDRETDSPKTEAVEEEKPADVDKSDPTEVDETDIEDETEPEENNDETETDETELAEEDIDKLPEDTSTDINEGEEEEDIHLDDIKEKLMTPETVQEEQRDEPNERRAHVDEPSDKKEDTTETEADEAGNADGEGSMFGSIWSDNSEGKIAENEGIDTNHLSHGEHAANIPNPDINTGDHIETLIKSGDGAMHEHVNNGDEKSLESDTSEMHEGRQFNGRKIEIDKGISKTESDDGMYKDDNGKTIRASKDMNETESNADMSLSEHVDADDENMLLDPITKLTHDSHDSDKLVNDIENGNAHLKDILKSSLPEGNDVHQYKVEHSSSENPIPISDPIDTDMFSIEMNHDKLDYIKDDLLRSKETKSNGHDSDKINGKEVIDDSKNMPKDGVKVVEETSDSPGKIETVLPNAIKDENDEWMANQPDNSQELKDNSIMLDTDKDKITETAGDDKLAGDTEADMNANQEFVGSNEEDGIPVGSGKTNLTDTLTNKTKSDKDNEPLDAEDAVVIKEGNHDQQHSGDSSANGNDRNANKNEKNDVGKDMAIEKQGMDARQLRTHELKKHTLSPETDVKGDTAKVSVEGKPDKQVDNSGEDEDSNIQESKDKALNTLYNSENERNSNHIGGSSKSIKTDADETGANIKNDPEAFKEASVGHNESKKLEDSNGEEVTSEQTDGDKQELGADEVKANERIVSIQSRDPEDTGVEKNVDIKGDADTEEEKPVNDDDKSNFVHVDEEEKPVNDDDKSNFVHVDEEEKPVNDEDKSNFVHADEEKKPVIDEDKSSIEDESKGIIDEAVLSPFQKKDDETKDAGNQDLPEDYTGEQNKERDSGDREKQSGEGHDGEQNVSDIQVNRETNEETVDISEKDEVAEKMIDNIEKVMEAMASVKEEVKDVNLERKENGKDDLKFVNDKGDVIEEVGRENEKLENEQKEHVDTPDSSVKEMEQETDIYDDKKTQSDTVDEDLTKERKEIDEQKLSKFEELASGMMSILATPTLSEPSAEIPSSVPENTRPFDVVVTETKDRVDGTPLTGSEAQISETNVNVESATETMQPTVVEQVQTSLTDNQMTTQTSDSVVQGADTDKPVQGDTIGGGVVIDGTTFDADYFGDEMTSSNIQATDEIITTSSVLDNRVYTPAGNVKPTKLFDAPVEVEQTSLPPNMQQDVYDQHYEIPNELEAQQTSVPEYIHASETVKDQPIDQENLPSDNVNVLGTSFSVVTSKVEETRTQPIESIGVDFETLTLNNNETVASDNVQDLVQPSLDQNAYNTDVFISRKPLSTEPASVETSVETDMPSQETSIKSEPTTQGQEETKQETDQNNNEVTEKITEEDQKKEGDWTHFATEGNLDDTTTVSTLETPEQVDPYSSVEQMYSRKVPDPDLDEELKQPDEQFIKMLELYLKSLINMLPPSLQTVLEQEPLGLSPTLTMLVSMISTNVLALLTCMGCMCKGKKKQSGKKDPLVVIRELEEKLFIATKEKENLEDDLHIKNKKVTEIQEELNSQQSTTGTVETDMKTIKLHNESLKKQLSEVQTELEDYRQEATEKSQIVVYKDSELQTYLAEVQSLTQRAQDAELGLQKTSHGLGEKEEELRLSLQQIQSLSEQIQQLETSKQQLNDEAVHWSEKVKDLTEQVEQFSTESKRMQEDLAFKENELEVLRDCFLQVKAFQGEDEMKEETEETPDLGEKLKQMMDVSRVNASLRSVEEERDVIQNKLLIEVESRKELEDQVQLLKRKFEGNQTDKMKAERQCQEAQTKLEVLSKYFKEKEAELTRQLGEQEVLKNQNISKLQSSDSITQELSKENDSYRQQIEDLKTEISKAERDFRSQIAANEKKAHENWLATRAAERELKESRHECGMLRQKLTDLERKLMQGPPPGLIRPITHRAMPPPGMLNGPPPPPPERPGSRGSVHGHVTPRLRDDDYRASPIGPDRMPPPPDRRLPPGPMGPRPPPPPLDAMSPPPYAIRPPFPPDRRSPPSFDRYPPPRGPRPPYPRPPPPHLRSPPPMGSNLPEHDDSKQDPYNRAPQGSRDRGSTRHQSQV